MVDNPHKMVVVHHNQYDHRRTLLVILQYLLHIYQNRTDYFVPHRNTEKSLVKMDETTPCSIHEEDFFTNLSSLDWFTSSNIVIAVFGAGFS